jgi:Amt family ammonium transporter
VPWFTMNILARKMPFLERHFDDALGIGHTHMVAGFVGGFGTGLWATIDGCAAFGLTNPGGAIAGNGMQLGYQVAGAAFIIGWNLVWTSLILLFIKHVLRIPLRMTEEQCKQFSMLIVSRLPHPTVSQLAYNSKSLS